MSITAQPRPSQPGHTITDNPFKHYYCCDPDVALCGADISGEEEDVGDDDLEQLCPMCEVLDDRPCGAAGCPDA